VGLFKKKQPETRPVPETTVSFHSEVVQAGDAGGLKDEILQALQEHGIQPGSGQVIDANQIPGLSEEIMKALGEHGIQMGTFEGMTAIPGAAAAEPDPVEQLARLVELHRKGGLSDYEFAVAKQKLLGENWQG
jgi:hypothetical protein